MKNEDKLEWAKKDLEEILKGLDCSDCRNQLNGFAIGMTLMLKAMS